MYVYIYFIFFYFATGIAFFSILFINSIYFCYGGLWVKIFDLIYFFACALSQIFSPFQNAIHPQKMGEKVAQVSEFYLFLFFLLPRYFLNPTVVLIATRIKIGLLFFFHPYFVI